MPSNRPQPRTAEQITYGVEIECFLPTTHRIPVGAYHVGVQVPGLPPGWRAQRDGSLHTRNGHQYGVEIVSPVLSGTAGLQQIALVTRTLRAWGAEVNESCGLHVHVGVRPDDPRSINNLLWSVANFETAIYASTGTTRRMTGSYSRTIKRLPAPKRPNSLRDLQIADGRYHSLNLQNVVNGGKPTVEFRAFAGTVNTAKILGYVRMAVALMERAETQRRIGWNAKTPKPTSTIARKSGPGATDLTRLFYALGWTAGREKRTWGLGDTPGTPSLKEIKTTLMRLARKFDAALAGRETTAA